MQAAAILTAVACVSGGSEEAGGPSPDSSATGSPAVASARYVPDLSDVVLDPDTLRGVDLTLLETASRQQAAAAEDGSLSFAEYEQAVLATVECWEPLGYGLTHGLRLTAYGYYYLEYSWLPELGKPQPTEAIDAQAQDCVQAHLQPIHEIWSYAKSTTVPQRVLDAAHDLLWACIADSGVDLRGQPPGLQAFAAIRQANVQSDLEQFRECQERVFDQIGLPNWVG